MTKSYFNHTDDLDTWQETMSFLDRMYKSLPEGMVIDYVSIDRPYDNPAKFHVEFSSRTPHPDFDTQPTDEVNT